MASNRRRADLREEVGKQLARRSGAYSEELRAAQEALAYLSWFAWHCSRFAALPSFLDAARSDVVAILYAGAVGLERSAYLHARSIVENLIRHCYFDSRQSMFVARQLEVDDWVSDKWTEL